MKSKRHHGYLIPLAVVLSGCGYQQTGIENGNVTPGYKWHSLYQEDIQTVAVPIFVNRTYHRGLEMQLTKSIIQQIEEHSQYKVVPRERADTILEGEILSADITTQSNDANTGLPQQQLYAIIVNFTWKNLRTGNIIVQRKNFDQRSDFFPTLGESQTLGSTMTLDGLAQGIVEELQADW
jgi:hypothetical protein